MKFRVCVVVMTLAVGLGILLEGLRPVAGQVREMRVSTGESTMTQDEIMARVRDAYAKVFDMDSIAADVDRRGIDFQVESAYANKIKFFRGLAVTNALWRADDRRKALSAKPSNDQTLADLQESAKADNKSLPFIEQVRARAVAYVNSLPNYIVRENIQRYQRQPATAWKLGDYIELDVTYDTEKGETLKLRQINGSSTARTIDEIGGLTSTGQFAGHLKMLFDPESKTEFREEGETDFFGQPCLVYGYRVEARNSKQQVRIGRASTVTGFRGQIYVNRDTRLILRIDQELTEIPPDFPLQGASSTVEFGWVTISGRDFLLPVSSRVSLTDKQARTTSLNCITFHKYGKFETDVKIVD